MSQNSMTVTVEGLEYQIIAGWDRPLRQLFVSLEPQFDPDELTDEAQIQSADKMFDAFFPLQAAEFRDADALNYMVHTLLSINLPDTLVQALKEDVALDLGNVMRVFAPDGSLLSSFKG